MDLRAGQLVGGKYELDRQIGVGGMAAIWSARHVGLDSEVAIKFRKPRESDRATAEARFVAEARNAARVKSRFVIQIHDFGITDDGLSYIVQEKLDGDDLGHVMGRGPALTVSDAVTVGCQCLTGLEAVHGAGILHRDMKPENIFLVEDGGGLFPKLLDFGVSKAESRAEVEKAADGARARQLTEPGNRVGTPEYMSPEQIRGAAVDASADTYSLAMILFELLCGRRPYEFDDVLENGTMTFLEAPSLFDLRPELGKPLSDVLTRAMAPTPTDRYRSAAEMRQALESALAGLPDRYTVIQDGSHQDPSRAARDAQPTEEDPAQPSAVEAGPAVVVRRRGPARAMAAILLMAVTLLALWIFGGPATDGPAPPVAGAAQRPVSDPPADPQLPSPEAAPEPGEPRAEPGTPPAETAAPLEPTPHVEAVVAPRPVAPRPVAKKRKVGDNADSPDEKTNSYRDPDF